MDSSSSSSPPPPPPQWEYDVFLSFRGEDTRNTFTAHLCDALWRRGINVFIDDPKLKKGQLISPTLLTAIEHSMFCIIVLSTDYASSSWCLEELVKILESKTNTPERVLPIFYNVDPSDVRKQRGEFGKSFERLVENLTDPGMKGRVETWREALKQVAKIAGWDSRNRHEPSLIKEIIWTISNKLFCRFPIEEQNLAGINYRIEEVMSLLCITSLDVVTIGICGMGGVGKTTLANAVYRQISHQFECSAFLENVGDDFRKQGLISLKQKLLSQLVDDGNINMKGCTSLEGKLCWRKVLIVLDNVNDGALLEYLTANQDLFGPASRIIITTREKDLLTSFSVKYYEVEILNEHEAMQVLGQYFSKHKIPADDLRELCDGIIRYAQGLPLALKILGPLLFGKKKPEWRSHLNKLEATPHPKIQQVLQISYDELDNKDKNIFLDIACFFKDEDKDRVMEILEACGFFPHCGLQTLLGKSLITISSNKLKMHDLIQAMAMEVVRQNSPNEPGKWSRLWWHEDVSHVLKKETGTDEVEGVFLDLSNLREIKFTSEAFARMINLRLLKIYIPKYSQKECPVQFSRNFTFHSGDLRYLHWHGYSLKSLPREFIPENLVELSMPYSQMNQPWEGKKDLEKLKFLDLSHSQFLKKIPDLSKATNLILLDLTNCKRLKSLPNEICNLESLETLLHSDCSKLDSLPHDFGKLRRLRKLNADRTALRRLPDSFGDLRFTLQEVSFSGCKALQTSASWHLPWKKSYSLDFLFPQLSAFHSLEKLNLRNCNIQDGMLLHSLCLLSSLRKLNLSRNNFVRLPSSFSELSRLHSLDLRDCRKLQALPELPSCIDIIRATDCLSLERIPNLHRASRIDFNNCLELEDYRSIIKSMLLNGILKYGSLHDSWHAIIPGNRIPEWFSHQNEGHEAYITRSPNLNSSNFLGYAFCLVLNPKFTDVTAFTYDVDFHSLDGLSNSAFTGSFSYMGMIKSDHLMLGLLSYPSPKEWHGTKISFTVNPKKIGITRCGVRLMYIEDMIEYDSASQPSSVVLQELNNSTPEDIEVKRTDGTCVSVEDSQSEGTIEEENPNVEEDISLSGGEPSGNECIGSKAQERKKKGKEGHHPWWNAVRECLCCLNFISELSSIFFCFKNKS